MAMQKKKVIIIVGPTASGKSDLAVKIAKKFNGEIISADSRQVYKGLDIATGKVTQKEMKGIPHHLLDVANPKRQFTVTQYKKLADKAMSSMLKRGKLPIIVGGTGFYIQAMTDNAIFPEVKPDLRLRKELERKGKKDLFQILKKIDPRRAEEIDKNNPRRLIRAIEIAQTLGQVPKIVTKPDPNLELFFLGLKPDEEKLKNKIKERVKKRLKKGMVQEAKKLHQKGLSWKRMESLGLEYRLLAQFLQGYISKKEFSDKLYQEDLNYAKRQMTWFKKDKRISWVTKEDEALRGVEKFLKR